MTSNGILSDVFHLNRQPNEFTYNILNPNKWWVSDQKNMLLVFSETVFYVRVWYSRNLRQRPS